MRRVTMLLILLSTICHEGCSSAILPDFGIFEQKIGIQSRGEASSHCRVRDYEISREYVGPIEGSERNEELSYCDRIIGVDPEVYVRQVMWRGERRHGLLVFFTGKGQRGLKMRRVTMLLILLSTICHEGCSSVILPDFGIFEQKIGIQSRGEASSHCRVRDYEISREYVGPIEGSERNEEFSYCDRIIGVDPEVYVRQVLWMKEIYEAGRDANKGLSSEKKIDLPGIESVEAAKEFLR